MIAELPRPPDCEARREPRSSLFLLLPQLPHPPGAPSDKVQHLLAFGAHFYFAVLKQFGAVKVI